MQRAKQDSVKVFIEPRFSKFSQIFMLNQEKGAT